MTKTIQGPPAAEINWDSLKGKVVVLEFWKTTCVPCVQVIPHLNELAEQFKNRPVVFISVTTENEEVVRHFLNNRPMKTWMGLDDYEALDNAFHVVGIPYAIITDASGRIAAITYPAHVKPEHLEEILAGKKCSLPEPSANSTDTSSVEMVPNQAPALFEISIREHKTPQPVSGANCFWSHTEGGCGFEGTLATMESALNFVFDKTSNRTAIKCKLPAGYYDFKLRAPSGHLNELRSGFRAALRTTFGIEVKQLTNLMDVYILTQVNPAAPGFAKVDKSAGGGAIGGGFRLKGSRMARVASYLESAMGKPVFDETGLKGFFKADIKWKLSEAEQLMAAADPKVWKAIKANPDGDWISNLPPELREGKALELAKQLQTELKKPESEQFLSNPEFVIAAVQERLGLQLTPVKRPVEILEISEASR